MMNKATYIAVILLTIYFFSFPLSSEEITGKITDVKLYPGRAELTRVVHLNLNQGKNRIVISGLPDSLLDWSVRGSFDENFQGRIESLKVERRILLEERKKQVRDIEESLDKLNRKDRVLQDKLNTLDGEMEFLNAFRDSLSRTKGPEILKGKEDLKKVASSMTFYSSQLNSINERRRGVETERLALGKEIQRLEFELNLLTGKKYMQAVTDINRELRKKGSMKAEQSYLNVADDYNTALNFMIAPTNPVPREKTIILELNSQKKQNVSFTFKHLVDGGRWNMNYDLRAEPSQKTARLIIYGDLEQTTGEDWKNVSLALSTGSPSTLSDFSLSPRKLVAYNIEEQEKRYNKKDYYSDDIQQSVAQRSMGAEAADEGYFDREEDTSTDTSGFYMEFRFPGLITVNSEKGDQRRRLKEVSLPLDADSLRFELFPEERPNALLKYTVKNPGPEVWLSGNARLYYEGQFTGNSSLPRLKSGAEKNVLLGSEDRLTARKTLINRYEDSRGVFAGKKRIRYSYEIEIENALKEEKKVYLYDRIPVSQSESVEVVVEPGKSGLPPEDPAFKEDYRYQSGIRRYTINLAPGKKFTYTYDVIITHDEDFRVSGLP